MGWEIEISDRSADTDVAELHAALDEHNATTTGYRDGRALLAAAEAEARRRGCTTIVLDTHSFQAPDLYPALGYEQVGETRETPAGHTQLLFQKAL